MHVLLPAFIMETIWSIVCRMRGVSAAANPSSLPVSLLRSVPPLNAIPLYISHSLSCLVPFSPCPVHPLMSLEYSSRVFVLSHLPCRAALCGDTRTTKLLIAHHHGAFMSRERERFPAACVTCDKRGHAQIARSN